MSALVSSWATSPGTAKSMRSNRSRDTSLELRVRRALHSTALRYRVDLAPIAGIRTRADIVFTKRRIAIYLDGCFWHGCPDHGSTPAANADYWIAKLKRNRTRDLDVTQRLQEEGWTVLRFWEHEPVDSIIKTITETLDDQRALHVPGSNR